MNPKALLCLLLLPSGLLVGCLGKSRTAAAIEPPSRSQSGAASAASPTMLEGLDAREALALANRWGTGTPEVQSFVDTESVVITFKKSGKRVSIPLPADRMVVAIAPYIGRTHPCEIHYMSGCQGELVEVPVRVTAVLTDGTVLFEERVTTMENGFFELWLPRDQTIRLSLEALGRTVSAEIGTYSDSNTCITTLQLL